MKLKLIFCCSILHVFIVTVSAQEKANVKFGDVTEKDFAKKVYSIDSNAAAVVIADIGQLPAAQHDVNRAVIAEELLPVPERQIPDDRSLETVRAVVIRDALFQTQVVDIERTAVIAADQRRLDVLKRLREVVVPVNRQALAHPLIDNDLH